MDKPTQLMALQTAKQDLTELSFCKATAKDLSAWINALPKANIGELARLIYKAMAELNRLEVNVELRYQLLEIVRPEINFITTQLEKNHLQQSVILDERGRKVANLCQALQNMLSTGYKLCINHAISESREQQRGSQRFLNTLAHSLQRAIQSLYTSLARVYQLYYPVPASLWYELHQLYLLACRNKLQTNKIKDELLGELKEQTVEQAYCCALLIGSARINQMRQADIALLASLLPRWVHLASIQNADAPTTLFVVAPHSDAPPRYKALLNISNIEQLIGLDTRELAKALEKWLQLPPDKKASANIYVPVNAQPTFLALLCNAWGDIAKRDFKRIPGNGTLDICLGLTAVHFYMSGGKSFEETLLKDASTTAQYSLDNSAPDVWANAFDADDSSQDPLLQDIIDYTPAGGLANTVEREESAVALFPSYTINIVNQSPGGYCLEWSENAPPQLQAGDIIALQNNSEDSWGTAVIRWIRQIRNGGAQIGVELLAPNAQPCGVQLLRQGESSSNFLRGLLIPEIPAISRPASLITPRIPFQEGSRVNINHAGEEFRATLDKRTIHTASISQYNYKKALMAENTQSSTAAKPAAPNPFLPAEPKPAPGDDFDSLWKIL